MALIQGDFSKKHTWHKALEGKNSSTSQATDQDVHKTFCSIKAVQSNSNLNENNPEVEKRQGA